MVKSFKKRLLPSIVVASMILITGCEDAAETTKKVTKDVEEKIQAEATKDNEFLLSVKSGHLESYPDIMIEEAFANFFSSPTWKYFKAETGEEVVEFTGYCTYVEKKVKAKLQFIVEEGKETFEIGALEFNDVPQNELTKIALVQAIYEGETAASDQSEVVTTETTSDTDPDLAGNDSGLIEKAMDSYMLELDADTIGNIFNDSLFGDPTWSVGDAGEVIFNGNYSGEIVPGEDSNLEFVLEEVDVDYYSISSLKYNGEEVSEEGFVSILDMIHFAVSQ